MSERALHSAVADVRGHWWTLTGVCFGSILITINVTVVNVALPSIRLDLRFSDTSLVWVVNAYLTTFGGFLFLGGRLGDFLGYRRAFLLGIALFMLGALCCAFATSAGLLVAARSVQGIAGAVVSTVALSLVATLFTDVRTRARALGICGFVGASGGSIGLLLGGSLTSALGWRWIFLINALLGAAAYAMCRAVLPRDDIANVRGPLDPKGPAVVTTAVMLTVYAILNGHRVGWSSAQTLILLSGAGALLLLLRHIEARARTPLVPLALFRIRNVVVANVASALLAAALLAWTFISALYLQLILDLSPFQVGLAFLPANLITAVMSLVVSPALVMRLGIKGPLVVGMFVVSTGLALLSRVPEGAHVGLDVLPGMVLMGLGAGLAYNPLLLSALSGVSSGDSGAASGIINSSFVIGGALGLSVLASVAAARTDDLVAAGAGLAFALRGGYQAAFCIGAIFAAIAALIIGVFLQSAQHPLQPNKENVAT